MKKLIIITFLAITSVAHAQNDKIKRLDEKNGYGGIKLGDTIINIHLPTSPTIGNSTVDNYGVSSYIINDQSLMKIGDEVELSNIIVRCYKNRIIDIELYFNSLYFNKIITMLQMNYGPESPRKERELNYIWSAKKVSLSCLFDVDKRHQHITFSDIELNNSYQLKYQASLKKAASDL